jgi:hypothetical protein
MRRKLIFGTVAAVALGALSTVAHAADPTLPSDARLEPVRPQLEATVSKTARAGLPAELLVSKVREGLAKGVDVHRIEKAVARLADGLVSARGFVAERRPEAARNPELVRAVAEAHLAKVDLKGADAVIKTPRSPAEVARAVEVLTDLAGRGYPVDHAAAVVKEVLVREPEAVSRVPSALESVRNEQALSPGETVAAIARNMRAGSGLSGAASKAREDNRGRGVGSSKSDSAPGKANQDNFVPPGQLKKQDLATQKGKEKASSGMGMGQGRGMGQGQGRGKN